MELYSLLAPPAEAGRCSRGKGCYRAVAPSLEAGESGGIVTGLSRHSFYFHTAKISRPSLTMAASSSRVIRLSSSADPSALRNSPASFMVFATF